MEVLGDGPAVDDSAQVLYSQAFLDGVDERTRHARIDAKVPPALGKVQVVIGEGHPCRYERVERRLCQMRQALPEVVPESLAGDIPESLLAERPTLPAADPLPFGPVVAHSPEGFLYLIVPRSGRRRSAVISGVCGLAAHKKGQYRLLFLIRTASSRRTPESLATILTYMFGNGGDCLQRVAADPADACRR